MQEIKQRKERSFEKIDSVKEVFNLLKTAFEEKKLYVKYLMEKRSIQINEILDDGSLMLVTDPDFVPENDTIIAYGLLDRYIEIILHVEEFRGPGYFKCRVEGANRATRIRKDLRFKVNPEEVSAKNFRVSKHTIDVSNFRIPTSIKVILDQFNSQNTKLSDIVKVGLLEYGDPVLNEIKKTGKTLYIEDISNQESYKPFSDDFIDAVDLYGDKLVPVIKKNIEKGYKSIIIVPVIYISEMEQPLPFAYVQIISKTEKFSITKVLEIKELTFDLIDRIRFANTLIVTVNQDIVDLSKRGTKIRITDKNLQQYLVHNKGVIFDIVFKLQAPITVYGEIKSSYKDDSGNMFIGVDFEGNSSRQDEMKRFNSIIDPMIKDYKLKLLKARRHGD